MSHHKHAVPGFPSILCEAYGDCKDAYEKCKSLASFKRDVKIETLEAQLRGGYEAMAHINTTYAEADIANDTMVLDAYESDLCAGEKSWK